MSKVRCSALSTDVVVEVWCPSGGQVRLIGIRCNGGRRELNICLRQQCNASASGAKAEFRARLVAIITKISSQPSPATTAPHARYIHTVTMGLAGQKKCGFYVSVHHSKVLITNTGATKSQRIPTTPHGRNRQRTTATGSWQNQAGNPDNSLELKMQATPTTTLQPTPPTSA